MQCSVFTLSTRRVYNMSKQMCKISGWPSQHVWTHIRHTHFVDFVQPQTELIVRAIRMQADTLQLKLSNAYLMLEIDEPLAKHSPNTHTHAQ